MGGRFQAARDLLNTIDINMLPKIDEFKMSEGRPYPGTIHPS